MYGCDSWCEKKIDSFEICCLRRAVWISWTARKTNRWVIGGKNDKTEIVLLWAHQEKTGFFGKDSDAGKNRRQQEKRKTRRWIDSIKEAVGVSLQS